MYLYLLGAGASCDCLPLVKDFPERMRQRAETMMERERFLNDADKLPSGQIPSEVLKEFVESLTWLSGLTKNHASVDTLAKKLFVTNSGDLLRLKATLSCYLWIEQVLRPTDMRYDAFFASIIERHNYDIRLPDNIKILSWNYDSQIERAFFPYWGEGRSSGLYKALQAYPDRLGSTENIDTKKFCVIRLNGIAGLQTSEDGRIGRIKNLFSIIKQEDAMQPLVEMYERYMTRPEEAYPLFGFAWDEQVHIEKFRNDATEVASLAEVLIVIGYSFPFFNRKVDRKILGSMKNVRQVYVQVPKEYYAGIKTRMESAAPNLKNIELIEDLKQFYIPHDF